MSELAEELPFKTYAVVTTDDIISDHDDLDEALRANETFEGPSRVIRVADGEWMSPEKGEPPRPRAIEDVAAAAARYRARRAVVVQYSVVTSRGRPLLSYVTLERARAVSASIRGTHVRRIVDDKPVTITSSEVSDEQLDKALEQIGGAVGAEHLELDQVLAQGVTARDEASAIEDLA